MKQNWVNFEWEFSPYRKTQDLRELIDLIRDHGTEFPELLMEIRIFFPFAVEYRYNYLPIDDEDPFNRQKTLDLVRHLRKWIENEILKPESTTSPLTIDIK